MSLFEVSDQGAVVVHGNLDRDTLTKDWWQRLTNAERNSLTSLKTCVFDLSDVERVDSAGLAWLVNAIRDGRKEGISITLREPPAKLLKLAKISDVDTLLPLD